MMSSWPPKTHFYSIFSKFLQIITYLTTITSKLSYKQWWRLFTLLRRSLWNKIIPEIIAILAVWRLLDPQYSTFLAFWANFEDFCLFDHCNINYPIKPWWKWFTPLRISLWNKIYPKIHHHFGPMTSSWPQKTHFYSIFSKFCRLLPIWPLLHRNYSINHGGDCLHHSGDHFKTKLFPKLSPFWPSDVFLTPNTALF